MQEISYTKKIINLLINYMFVKKRGIRSTAAFKPLVNWKVPSNIRKLAGIVQTFGKKYDKTYLFFNCERPVVDILEHSTWVIKVKMYINNAFQLTLDY